jgi:hypothetical protein
MKAGAKQADRAGSRKRMTGPSPFVVIPGACARRGLHEAPPGLLPAAL